MSGFKVILAMIGALLLVPKRVLAAYVPAVVATSTDVSSTDVSAAMKTSYLGQKGVPAIRNNNPLNIRKSSNAWKGKISPSADPNFEQFNYWVYGLRAAIINLRTYYNRDKLTTIRGIVNKWAPSVENDTSAYVAFVSVNSGIPESSPIIWNKETVYKLVSAMAKMEAGKDTITRAHFDAAWSLV